MRGKNKVESMDDATIWWVKFGTYFYIVYIQKLYMYISFYVVHIQNIYLCILIISMYYTLG